MNYSLLFAFTLFMQFVNFGQTDSLNFEDRIPAWANKVLEKSELFGNYTIIDTINPFYFEDDFNGDELIDIVFLVRHKLTGASGTFIINGGKNLCFVMGAGKSIGMGYSVDWCNKWFIFRDRAIYNFSGKKIKTVIRTPGIELRQSEDTSIIIYWDRRRYLAAVKSV